MASSFLTRFRSGPFLRNEAGVQKYAEMALGQLIRRVAKSSRIDREQSESLLVEKANLRRMQQEMTDQPVLEPGAFFKMQRRLWANQAIVAVALIGSVAIAFISISAFLEASSAQLGVWRWVLSAIFAAILGGGGLIVTERLVESVVARRGESEASDEDGDGRFEVQPRGAAVLWMMLLLGLELGILGLAEVRASQLQAQTGSFLLYLGFLVVALLLPIVGGAMRWDAMRYVNLYKTTDLHRKVDERLSRIDSQLRQSEEFESNSYKVRLLTTWDEINGFRTIKENYNARKGITEPLTGHYASAFDLFQGEAARRYEADLRDLTSKSLRRLDSVDGATQQVGGKIGQAPAVQGITPAAATLEYDGEAYDAAPPTYGAPRAPSPDSPMYLTPKPVR